MDADYNKHTPFLFFFPALPQLIAFSFHIFLFLSFKLSLDGTRLTTARFHTSVTMEEQFNNNCL